MQRFTAVKADAPQSDVALALIVDAELFRLEAMVRWLDTADARLPQLLASPSPAAAPHPTGAAPVDPEEVRS